MGSQAATLLRREQPSRRNFLFLNGRRYALPESMNHLAELKAVAAVRSVLASGFGNPSRLECSASSSLVKTDATRPHRSSRTHPPNLTPRLQQVLQHLLGGESEKEIAGFLTISRHTVHVHVKALYRHCGVRSRGELLSLWICVPAFAEMAADTEDAPAERKLESAALQRHGSRLASSSH